MKNALNEKLSKIYKEAKDELVSENSNLIGEVAHPLLLSVPDDYEDKKIKVMVFGKETNGWLNFNMNIEEAMQRYYRFWIDKKSKNSNKGAFMQVLNKFEKMFEKDETSFIWNNVIKIGKKDEIKNGEAGTPPKHIIAWQSNWFNVIQEEIKILKPDIMIFFTGPSYDKYIEKSFGKFDTEKIEEVVFKVNFHNHKDIIAFRTYHPQYLRLNGLEKDVLEFLKENIKDIK